MLFYFFIFLISLGFYYIGIKSINIVRFVFLLFCALIPTIVAALRDETLGRDMTLYVIPFWELASSCNSFTGYQEVLPDTEISYLLLNYSISRFTSDIHYYMFAHQGILMLFIILTSFKFRRIAPSIFIIVFYFLYLYNTTYSMARQSLAIICFLYGSTFLLEKKYIIFFLFLFISISFHNSAVFGILLPLLLNLSDRFKNKFVLYSFITICVVIISISFQVLLPKLISIGLLSSKYTNYIGQEGFNSHKIDLLFLVSLIFIVKFLVKDKIKNVRIYNLTILLTYVSFCLTSLGGIVETANRAAYYFIIPLCFMLPLTTNSKMTQKKIITLSTGLLLIRFVYLALTVNISDTIPYVSKIF